MKKFKESLIPWAITSIIIVIIFGGIALLYPKSTDFVSNKECACTQNLSQLDVMIPKPIKLETPTSASYTDSGTETLPYGWYMESHYYIYSGEVDKMWSQTHLSSQTLDLYVMTIPAFDAFVDGATFYPLKSLPNTHDGILSFGQYTDMTLYFVWYNDVSGSDITFDYALDRYGDDLPSYSGHTWQNNQATINAGSYYASYGDYDPEDVINGGIKSYISTDLFDFFICDSANYAQYQSFGTVTTAYQQYYDCTTLTFGPFNPPTTDRWYFVISAVDQSDTVTVATYVDRTDVPAKSITVTHPAAGESLYQGAANDIIWDWTGFFNYVDIELYKSSVFSQSLANDAPNTGTYSWSVPSDFTLSADYTVKVMVSTDHAINDLSDIFSIAPPFLDVVNPTPGQTWIRGNPYSITWNHGGGNTNVDINLYKNHVLYSSLATQIPNDGSFSWTISGSHEMGSVFSIYITDGVLIEESDFFTISDPTSLSIVSPTHSSILYIGESFDITWTTGGLITNISISLYHGIYFSRTIVETISNMNSYSWMVPTDLEKGKLWYLKIYDTANPSINDLSEYITITYPDDEFINNKDFSHSSTIAAGSYEDLISFEESWFKMYLAAYDTIVIRIDFTHTQGDLDLGLYSSGGTLLISSESTTNSEEIVYTVPDYGTYHIRVCYGSNPLFDMEISVTASTTTGTGTSSGTDTTSGPNGPGGRTIPGFPGVILLISMMMTMLLLGFSFRKPQRGNRMGWKLLLVICLVFTGISLTNGIYNNNTIEDTSTSLQTIPASALQAKGMGNVVVWGSPAKSGFDFEFEVGIQWIYSWHHWEWQWQQGEDPETLEENWGTITIKLSSSVIINGIKGYTLSKSGSYGDYSIRWNYITLWGYQILGSTSGSYWSVIFDARNGEWTGGGFFKDWGSMDFDNPAYLAVWEEHDYIPGQLAYWMGTSRSEGGCVYYPSGGTICAEDYSQLFEYEYFFKNIGPAGHCYFAVYTYSGGGFYSQHNFESYLGLTSTNMDDTQP